MSHAIAEPGAPSEVLPSAPSSGDIIARQAILDIRGGVYGYELFDRSRAANGHSAASDAQLLFNVLTHPDASILADHKPLFLNCTHDSLSGTHLELVHPQRVVLELPLVDAEPEGQIEVRRQRLAELAGQGYRLAFDEGVLTKPYASWLPLASFIKLDLGALSPAAVEPCVALTARYTKAQVIAEKVETPEQYQRMVALGVKLFQGYLFSRPVPLNGQSIRPAQSAIVQLINLVRQQAKVERIEEVLKHDPSLSFNLLRLINSAGFGARGEVTSFKHAVMLMGLDKLYRWAAMLLTTSRLGDAPPSTGNTAIVRGRLMELLVAERLNNEDRDHAFVAGVFSLLDVMLGMPMDMAIAALALPKPVSEVLLHRSGVLAPFLELTLACEQVDDDTFARVAVQLGLTGQQVNLAHLQALAWAENMGVS